MFQEFEKPRKVPKLSLKIPYNTMSMIDSQSNDEEEEEESFEGDKLVTDLEQEHEETAPALSCYTCGEEIDGKEIVKGDKLYCSEECMDRERPSIIPAETTRRRVR